ncbi:TPA: hypothetical protein DEO28_02220 [Candidatus Dependentiae bacterium]|nr:MAG: hypothetical protein UR14_C0009G0009 [candidate division TM6 bacterium GW2011_GWE2_31_21]KKP52550.1 MAG: hypothetical protein UR43_C0012G0019 [candidate division TM6 bacterium GW2011_GWF2_33_332]HBS48456.1 hypothetical protein [Candidatus Dependentiae bacterium]HBZ73305.1 hypothetical protein [Candidatus Dependentiae bacterium]
MDIRKSSLMTGITFLVSCMHISAMFPSRSNDAVKQHAISLSKQQYEWLNIYSSLGVERLVSEMIEKITCSYEKRNEKELIMLKKSIIDFFSMLCPDIKQELRVLIIKKFQEMQNIRNIDVSEFLYSCVIKIF